MNMNSIKLSAFALATLLGATACQKDFEKINTDHRLPKEADLLLDGLKSGAFFSSFQQKIFPVGSSGTDYVNDYQIPYTLGAGCWMGYMAPTKNKWVGRGFPTYSLRGGWNDYTASIIGGKTLQDWATLKESTQDDPAAFAVATISKVATVHKLTDTYGPVAYPLEGAEGQGLLSGYVAQDLVYYSMLQELHRAVNDLEKERRNILPKYDVIYEGDYQKWQKLGNSLLLRLANRLSYAAPDTARKYAELAISNPAGVIETTKETAQLSRGAGLVFKNPLTIINKDYNDVRMGAEIYSYLKGYQDPRAARYFTQGKQPVNGTEVTDYYAVRTNLPETGLYEDATKYSILNVEDATPIYIMRPSEVYFLRAEGAMRGWAMGAGTAETFYNTAIERSFEENGLSASEAVAYASNASRVPARYVDNVVSAYSIDPVSTITIKWREGDSDELKLERIITQKYLALFPDGQEAWSEYRRTGYPKIFPSVANHTDAEVDGDKRPTRLPFSNKEYTENLQNVQKAVRLLDGPDNGATRVWWDKKPNK